MQSLHPAQQLVIWALPVLFAITLHEVAHGWVANKLGDPTARMMGRITLNPFRHIDPIGTVLVPLVLFFAHAPLFGWAKPVPVTFQNLRRHRYGAAAVAVAGPAANVAQVLVWCVVLAIVVRAEQTGDWVNQAFGYMASEGIKVNIAFALLNLLPVLPLDGGRILDNFLPGPLSAKYSATESWGLFIVLGLVVTGMISYILSPPYHALIGVAEQLVRWGSQL